MKQTTVKLVNDGQEFIIKNSNRTIIVFEEIADKTIDQIKSTKDYFLWLYATLYACNLETFKFTWDEFLDLTDENPNLMKEFNDFNNQKDLIEPLVEHEKKTKKK